MNASENFSKKLKELKTLCRSLSPSKIQDDSKKINKGDIFIAIQGQTHDGHTFISEVCARNPKAIVVEKIENIPPSYKGEVFQVSSTKEIRPILVNEYYNFPSHKMFTIGVTGTNGKTTTTYLIEHLLSQGGWMVGVMGTINHHIQNQTWPSHLTTPFPIEIHERFQQMHEAGARAVALEVSSIAIDQKRVDGIQFNLVIFTNFTQDHLDYHKTMDNYFKAKVRLFEMARSYNHCIALLNIDDPKIKEFSKICRMPFFSYGQDKEAHFQYEIKESHIDHTLFQLTHKKQNYTVKLPLIGEHNVSNAVAALASSHIAGFSLKNMTQSIESFSGVPGRLERIPTSKPLYVFVDYAHTDSALKQTLINLKKLKKDSQNLILVFGCGGNRDKDKREKMGQVASLYADKIVITSDNPRHENPKEIIEHIVKGISQDKNKIFICPDRKEGIKTGITQARDNDIVLISGKGHERVQIIGIKKIPFDDKKVAQQFL